MREKFKIRSVVTASQVRHESNSEIVTYIKQKRDQKVKRIKNIAGQVMKQFKDFSFTQQKTRPRMDC